MYFAALSVIHAGALGKHLKLICPVVGSQVLSLICGESENATNTTLYDYSISKVILSFVDLDTLISLKSSVTMPEK